MDSALPKIDHTRNKSGYKYILWELGTVLVIWIISLWMSYGAFDYPYNRPLANWFTAHTLVSLRSLDDWGFSGLFGASVLIPHTYEMLDANLTTFTKDQGIYLSYPSLWVIFPYVIFKIVVLFDPNYELTPAFIVVYNLVITRLLGGVVVYFLFRYLLDYVFENYLFYRQLSPLGQRILAMIGLAGWMLPATALDSTQNTYLSDQAVLLPIYCLFLFTLKHRFDFGTLRSLDRSILGLLSFISVGMDWYGLVFVAVVFGTVTFMTCINLIDETKEEIFRKIALNVAMPLASGTAIALGFFVGQLIYFEDGFKQIIATFNRRAGKITDNNITLSYLQLYQGIVNYWQGYLSRPAIAVNKLPYVPTVATIPILVFAPVLAWMSTCKAWLNPKNYAVINLLYIAPCIQLILLKQHSYQHSFSAFKMALPISFSTCVLPATYVIYLASRLDAIPRAVREAICVVLLSAYLIILLIFPNGDYHIDRGGNPLPRDIGVFIQQELPSKAIIFSHNLRIEPFGFPFGPAQLWYSNRFVYTPETFASQKPKLRQNNVEGAEFLFIDYEDTVRENKIESNIIKLCAGKWFEYATSIEGRRIVGCNAPELKFALSK